MEKSKNIFLEMKIRDGEREYRYRVLFSTRCKNLEFAVQYYIAHFWGESYREDDYWYAFGGEIAMRCTTWEIVPDKELKIASKYLI